MNWIAIYFVCFGVGAGFVLISTVFGDVLSDADLGAMPFKPILIALFLTVFGGMGLIFQTFLYGWIATGAAALSAIALSYIVWREVILRLQRWQNTNVHEKQSLIGFTAKVSEKILQGGYGKITYVVNEKIVSSSAKSENGEPIDRNTIVEIVYIEKNTYYVRKKI
ncbi:MAG: hypothetical protein FWD01_01945 [Defluviitaleaceae bacterium]|nr:hypothetical protein [Defluviitaleaceae bacterium]